MVGILGQRLPAAATALAVLSVLARGFSAVSAVGNENQDKVRLTGDRDKIRFSFQTAGGVDGIDFRLQNERKLEFELYIDGQPAPAHLIFIGRHNVHPADNSFRIRL